MSVLYYLFICLCSNQAKVVGMANLLAFQLSNRLNMCRNGNAPVPISCDVQRIQQLAEGEGRLEI